MRTIDITIDPILVHIGALQFTWHGLISAIAILVAVQVWIVLARRDGLPGQSVSSIIPWAIVGGIIGARAFHVLDHLDYYTADPLSILLIWQGGIAVYGAFVGGLAAASLAAWRKDLPIWRLLDAVAPAALLGQAIGRAGCLLNGDTVGGPTDAGWGIVYRHPDALVPPELLGVPTHPYPLYEMVWVLGILGLLLLLRPRLSRRGDTFLLAVLGYAIGRFLLTVVRMEPVVAWGLQEAQIIAFMTGIIATTILLWRHWRPAPGTVTQSADIA